MKDDNEAQKSEDLIINDEDSELRRNTKSSSKISSLKKKLILTVIIILLIFIAIIIALVFIKKSQKTLGEILCQYKINDSSKKIQLVSKEFKGSSKIELIINGERFKDFKNQHKFEHNGLHNVSFLLYKDIQMDNMFKNNPYLVNVTMISEENLKINSMKSTFENCTNLIYFDISGFNIDNLKSVHKLFYKDKNLEKINLGFFKKNNIEDMSFLFAESNINNFDFSKIETTKVKNMSHMFYKCKDLEKVDSSHIKDSIVTDMSYMFSECKLLEDII